MKPLPQAPLTEIDRLILLHWCLLHDTADNPRDCICSFYSDSDRRDAELMFWAQRQRSYTFPVDLEPLYFLGLGGWINCGGALEEWKTLNITYFA